MVSTKKSLSKSAFLWDDQGQDHSASKEPKNTYPEWIHGFLWCTMITVILNDLSGSKSSQRNAPQCYGLMLSHLMELSDTGWITVQQSPISFQRHEKPGLQCTALFKTRIPRTPKNKQNASLSYTHHSFIPIKIVPFCFPNFDNV